MKKLFIFFALFVTVLFSNTFMETTEAYGTGAAFVPPVHYKTIPLHNPKKYHPGKTRYEIARENNTKTYYYYPYYNYSLPLYISYPSYGWYRYPVYNYYRPYYYGYNNYYRNHYYNDRYRYNRYDNHRYDNHHHDHYRNNSWHRQGPPPQHHHHRHHR